jgi:NodT family efflux transporter outer membrane factor (OMF) lipoprotein
VTTPLLRWIKLLPAMMLAACASTGDIHPQEKLTDVRTLDAGGPLNQSNPPWSKAQWWSVLGDTQLDDLIAEALHDNPNLAAASARVRGAQAQAGVARAATLPQVSGDGEFERYHFTEHEFIPPPYAGNDYWDNKLLLEAKYSLDLWGRDRAQLDAAIGEVQAAQAEQRAAQLSLQAAIVRSYVQLAQSYALHDVAQDALKLHQDVYDITHRRFDAGLATHVDLAQAESALPSARATLVDIEGHIAVLRTQLAALTGQGPGAGDKLQRPVLNLTQTLALPDTIPAHWIGRRPDIAADRWRVEAASQGIKAAEAQFYPDINISAFGGVQSLSFGDLLTGDSFLSGFGPAITLPIFTGGKLRAQLGAKTAGYDAAVARYNEALIEALQQASGSVISLRSIEQQRREIADAQRSADKAYTLALSGYRAGLTEYLTVLNTQSTLLREREQAATLDGHRLDAYAQLIATIGGGFDEQPVPLARGESK